MANSWELTSELTSKWITFNNTQSNFTPISLITFAVINQTSPNLQGSFLITANATCKTTCRKRWKIDVWIDVYMNYTFNNTQSNFTPSSLITSEFTSKWITFNNIQSNFTPSSLITFAVINQTSSNLHGSCRNTSRCCLQNYIKNS